MESSGRALSCIASLPIRADDGVHRRQVRLRSALLYYDAL